MFARVDYAIERFALSIIKENDDDDDDDDDHQAQRHDAMVCSW